MKFKKLLKKYILCLITLILLSFLVLFLLSKKAFPVVLEYADMNIKKISIEVLRNAGLKEFNEKLNEEELFYILKDGSGQIQSIDFNVKAMNELLMLVSKNVRTELKKIEKGEKSLDGLNSKLLSKRTKNGFIYEVPLGLVFDNIFLSTLGPRVPVRIEYVGNISLDIKSRVKEYGINGALIEIYIYVQVNQKVILPFQSKNSKLATEVPVVMKLVKGNIPYYLPSINRSYSASIN